MHYPEVDQPLPGVFHTDIAVRNIMDLCAIPVVYREYADSRCSAGAVTETVNHVDIRKMDICYFIRKGLKSDLHRVSVSVIPHNAIAYLYIPYIFTAFCKLLVRRYSSAFYSNTIIIGTHETAFHDYVFTA